MFQLASGADEGRRIDRRTFLSAVATASVAIVAAPFASTGLGAQDRAVNGSGFVTSGTSPVRVDSAMPSVGLPAVVVYKDPGCGCCKEWVKHMQKAGFAVTAHDTADMDAIKASMGVPRALQSCHTAVVGAYLLEGHVPADLVQKLLLEKPAAARGLAVPGMPSGSPGMEGGTKDKYDVVLFERSGKTRVYASR